MKKIFQLRTQLNFALITLALLLSACDLVGPEKIDEIAPDRTCSFDQVDIENQTSTNIKMQHSVMGTTLDQLHIECWNMASGKMYLEDGSLKTETFISLRLIIEVADYKGPGTYAITSLSLSSHEPQVDYTFARGANEKCDLTIEKDSRAHFVCTNLRDGDGKRTEVFNGRF